MGVLQMNKNPFKAIAISIIIGAVIVTEGYAKFILTEGMYHCSSFGRMALWK